MLHPASAQDGQDGAVALPARVLVVIALGGCVRELAIADFDRSTRDGFVEIGTTERVAVYASPDLAVDPRVVELADGRLVELFGRFGGTQRRRATLYLHALEDWPSSHGHLHGAAHCDDFSADAIGSAPGILEHELSHLTVCDTIGRNARPLLEEGIASWSSGPTGAASASGTWSLRSLFVGNTFKDELTPASYDVATHFVRFAIDELGVASYLDRVHHPAAFGTTDEVEQILERELGRSFVEVECELRTRMGCASSCGASCVCVPVDGGRENRCVPR